MVIGRFPDGLPRKGNDLSARLPFSGVVSDLTDCLALDPPDRRLPAPRNLWIAGDIFEGSGSEAYGSRFEPSRTTERGCWDLKCCDVEDVWRFSGHR